jgi:hypothetical protein
MCRKRKDRINRTVGGGSVPGTHRKAMKLGMNGKRLTVLIVAVVIGVLIAIFLPKSDETEQPIKIVFIDALRNYS